MKRFDKFFSAVVLGTIAPVTLMLTLWWGSVPFLKEQSQMILFLALSGFILGAVLDCTLLRRFLFRLFELPLSAFVVIEIFYSIMVYGFFMGFPVFNIFVGILGGYAVAKRGALLRTPMAEAIRSNRRINRFSAVLLLFFCTCSAVLALRESTICSQVKGMLNLPFPVTMPMIWAFILTGGGVLLLLQYLVAKNLSRKIIARDCPR
jgi:hypothetical protein